MSEEQALIPMMPQRVLLPFTTDLLAGQLRESSQKMYKRDLAAYLAFASQEHLEPLEASTLSRWRVALAAEVRGTRPDGKPRHYSPNTINRMLSAVKRLMAEAAEQKYLD